MNPTATVKADVGFVTASIPGKITQVNMEDIRNGKVQLPYVPWKQDKHDEKENKTEGSKNKGFAR
jgi:hypothetical protein